MESGTYVTDPPEGRIKCGATLEIKSSAACHGRPATIVGGCSDAGTKRATTCH